MIAAMLRRLPLRLGGLAASAALLCACSAERSQAVRISQDEKAQDAKDYHAMLKTARSRTAAEDTLGTIVTGLERFRSERGRLPTNLFEMVSSGTLPSIPPPPAGAAYGYDPRSGNIRMVPVDEAGKIAVPEDPFQAPSLLGKP